MGNLSRIHLFGSTSHTGQCGCREGVSEASMKLKPNSEACCWQVKKGVPEMAHGFLQANSGMSCDTATSGLSQENEETMQVLFLQSRI